MIPIKFPVVADMITVVSNQKLYSVEAVSTFLPFLTSDFRLASLSIGSGTTCADMTGSKAFRRIAATQQIMDSTHLTASGVPE